MKKSLHIIPALLAVAAIFLAGCGRNGGGSNPSSSQPTTSVTPGALTEEEKEAISKVMGGNVCMIEGTTPVVPGVVSEVSGDDNEYVQVVVEQKVAVTGGNQYTVSVSWSYAGYESQIYRFRDVAGDKYHKNFEFNFPAMGSEATGVDVVASPSVNGKVGDKVTFSLSLKPMTRQFPEWSISKIYELNDEETMFEHVSDAEKGYFEGTQPAGTTPNYCYIKTYGEVVYLAPDGNWGLIADGDLYIEIYAGNAYNLSEKYYADLKVGNKVDVYGEVTHYLGNIQVAFISKILTMSDPSKVSPVASVKSLNEQFLIDNNQICPDMNSLVQITGVYKSKDLTIDSARGKVVITVGSVDLTIAYDYHTSKEGSSTLFNEIVAVVSSATVGVTQITVKGTLRWANTSKDSTPVYGNTEGSWTIAPYLPGHFVEA